MERIIATHHIKSENFWLHADTFLATVEPIVHSTIFWNDTSSQLLNINNLNYMMWPYFITHGGA